MIYILLISLMILFYLSYLFSGKDLLAPATIQIISFTGAVFFCIYFMISVGEFYTFHWETIGLISATMAISAVIGICIHTVFNKVEVKEYVQENVAISPISPFANIIVILFMLITIFGLLMEIRRIGGSSDTISQAIAEFRRITSFSPDAGNRLPFLLSQMMVVTKVLFLLYGFNLIYFFHNLSCGMKLSNTLILCLICLCLLLQGNRGDLINQVISCFMVFHLIRIRKYGTFKPYDIKAFVRLISVFVVILGVFYVSKAFIGRTSQNEELNIANYTAFYCGNGLIELDRYLQKPLSPSNIWGKETFYGLNLFLSKFDGLGREIYSIHLEFRPLIAGYFSNTYTFLRSYHHDFGMVGVFVLHSISILCLSMFYEFVKKRRGYAGILIFSSMYYTIVMSFFAERFFSNLVTVSFAKQLILLMILYEVMLRKRFRFTFNHSMVRFAKAKTSISFAWKRGS